jgi:hypothetical protein
LSRDAEAEEFLGQWDGMGGEGDGEEEMEGSHGLSIVPQSVCLKARAEGKQVAGTKPFCGKCWGLGLRNGSGVGAVGFDL